MDVGLERREGDTEVADAGQEESDGSPFSSSDDGPFAKSSMYVCMQSLYLSYVIKAIQIAEYGSTLHSILTKQYYAEPPDFTNYIGTHTADHRTPA